MTTILGWDCSSTTIGWCALNIDESNKSITYIDSGIIKPPKDGDLFERLKLTQNEILKILNQFKPDKIAIEEIVSFMKGASTAKTIILLTTFNRMLGLTCYDFLNNQSPEMYNVMSIRHGLKLNKQLPAKEEIPELVAHHLNIKFPYFFETPKRGKNKGIKKIAEESYDRADGCAVALFAAMKHLTTNT